MEMSKSDKTLWLLSLNGWQTELTEKRLSLSGETRLQNWVNEDANGNRATKAVKLLSAKVKELRLAGCPSPARTAQQLMVEKLML